MAKAMTAQTGKTIEKIEVITTNYRACQENCVNGYVRISRLEPVCQIVWQIDLPLKPNF